MKVPSSSGGPIVSAAQQPDQALAEGARSTRRATKSRDSELQRWPVVAAIESAASATARSRSASASTIMRVLAAHLEGEELAGLVERGLAKRAADGPGAGEEHAVDTRVRREGAAGLGAALHQLEDARREARLGEGGGQPGADRGREIARLEHDALPVASAGTRWPFGRCAGKLKGPSTASTPRGWKLGARARARLDRRDEAEPVLEGRRPPWGRASAPRRARPRAPCPPRAR